jgi:NtrC-family two-component system sensor histidine kinase KinB
MTRALQLRTRLAIAGSLLIATTLLTGVWSVTAFRRVSRAAGQAVTDNEQVTDATARLAGALEREDDALLFALADAGGAAALARQRAEVAAALAQVAARIRAPDEHALAARLTADVDAYQRAADALVAAPREPDARPRYLDRVNPLLRRAVAAANELRDRHFRSSQAVAEWAGDQATRSMVIVGAISAAALALLVAIAVHLARVVVLPLGEATRAVQALRRGDFAQRVRVRRDDELGRLGGGLNQMADELERFRRANIGEVIRAKETLEAALEALPDAVLVIDPAGRVSAANPRATGALGPARGQALGELPVPPATRAAAQAALEAAPDAAIDAAPDAAVDLARAIELTVGGRPRRLLPRVVPIAGRGGAVLVLSDVTELVRLDQMRLELVAVASHELRTPLTTLRMTLLMLQERAAAYAARDRELVATALVGAEQLSTLVSEFLDLTRIEAGQLRLQWARVSPRELVEEAARAIAPACGESRLALAVELADDLPATIGGDRARLAMALSNLLANAVKFTPAGGRIAVRAAADAAGARVLLEVDDTGPGVPAEHRERVFDRFFRGDAAPRAEPAGAPGGVGIGLYVARQVIEAHGGAIRCEASPLGGARFVVTLPAEPAGPQNTIPESRSLATVK